MSPIWPPPWNKRSMPHRSGTWGSEAAAAAQPWPPWWVWRWSHWGPSKNGFRAWSFASCLEYPRHPRHILESEIWFSCGRFDLKYFSGCGLPKLENSPEMSKVMKDCGIQDVSFCPIFHSAGPCNLLVVGLVDDISPPWLFDAFCISHHLRSIMLVLPLRESTCNLLLGPKYAPHGNHVNISPKVTWFRYYYNACLHVIQCIPQPRKDRLQMVTIYWIDWNPQNHQIITKESKAMSRWGKRA